MNVNEPTGSVSQSFLWMIYCLHFARLVDHNCCYPHRIVALNNMLFFRDRFTSEIEVACHTH